VTDPREQIIRRGFEASVQGDQEAALRDIAQDVEIVTDTQDGAPTVYRGHEGWRSWNSSWMEVWDDVRWEIHWIEQHGDDFLAEIVSIGRGRGSGIELSQTLVWAFTIPGDKATRIGLYRDRDAALRAIGRSPTA
jgi:ketosteroid isomerase-like protein